MGVHVMSSHDVTYEKKDYAGTIKVPLCAGRPALARLAADLTGLCREIAWDNDVRLVVIAGAEKNTFCLEASSTPAGRERDEESPGYPISLASPIAQLDKPVIIALDGDVTGLGLEFAMACDIRIASDTCRFGLRQIHQGIIPADGGTQRLPRLVGPGKAIEMILTGEIIDACEAERVGLVNRVVSSDALMAVTMKMAFEMASKAPISLRFAKEALYKGMDLTLDQGLRMEGDLYLLLYSTGDRTEGIEAFKGRRKPMFEGE